MKKTFIISSLLIGVISFAQVAIGKASISTLADNTTPNSSISLEFGTGNKGIVVPWVTSETAVTGAVPGTIVYDLAQHKIKVKLASAWKDLSVDITGAASSTLQDGLSDQSTAKVIIGANPSTDSTPGILVLSDDNKAMILPKVASPHLNIKNPAAGMMAYDTTAKQLAVYNGTVWSFWKP